MYEYKCIINRVVDGDTVDVDIDLGFGVTLKDERVRLLGIDAPETRTRDLQEKERGLEAKKFVELMLPLGSEQILRTSGFNGKFGRILGDFLVYDHFNDSTVALTSILLREGLVEVYK
jgi:micrococcal nuclease